MPTTYSIRVVHVVSMATLLECTTGTNRGNMKEIIHEYWDEANKLLYQRKFTVFGDTMMVRSYTTCAFQDDIETARKSLCEVAQSPLWFTRDYAEMLLDVFKEASNE